MLSPQQLYKEYSTNPCIGGLSSPFTQISASIFYDYGVGEIGAGTPMNLQRIVNFFKLVKYPCVEDAPGYKDIEGTGSNKLSPTFKFLQLLDVEAYKERQPTVAAGTSYSVRNCCDLTRACYLTHTDSTNNWTHRMATEYLEYFAHRSLPDCLLMCGPDMINKVAAKNYRGPGGKVTKSEPVSSSGASDDDPDGTILAQAVRDDVGMLCFPLTSGGRGAPGASHGCFTAVGSDAPPKCYAWQPCETDPVTGEVTNPDSPCCKQGSIYHINECQNNGQLSVVDRDVDFSYWIKSDDGRFDGTIANGRMGEIVKHVGILERKIYHGYADFTNQCDGTNPPITLDDLFLTYFQKINGYNYYRDFHTEDGEIDRVRTMSIILKASIDSDANVTTDTDWMVERVKDLVHNGYGVMLLTNTGFNSNRDSTGVSYPDRVFYHTYNIIGYDDTKVDYPECVYVLQLPFGEWNTGGHPPWGPLPTGSFLVTESHLKCLVNYYPTSDFYGCRERLCINTVLNDCNDPSVRAEYEGCGAGIEGRCDPYYCTKEQRACGLLFTMSLNKGFPRQELDYKQFYPITAWKETLRNKAAYYKP